MSLPPHKYRELVFQILFRQHFLEEPEQEMVPFFMAQLKTTRLNVERALEDSKKVLSLKESIDKHIKEASTSYDIERIQVVELNILRLAVFEMLHQDDFSFKVAISEALRLAKKFSTKESVAFVNAILDHIYKNNHEPVYTG